MKIHKLLRMSSTNLCVIGERRGKELDTRLSHCSCSGDNILCVQPDVLDARGSVLLQEGVHLISACKEMKSFKRGIVLLTRARCISYLVQEAILQSQTCNQAHSSLRGGE